MNILIVDDDRYTLEGIRNGLNWECLPFENRYEARNAREARDILTAVPVDVLLCDIEMPQESGLDLVKWIRDQQLDVQVIFLTNYPDFGYAQRALRLKSFEYCLKPIEYEKLEKIIMNLIEIIVQQTTDKAFLEYGQRWIDSESHRKNVFWERLIGRRKPMLWEEIAELAEKTGCAYPQSHLFLTAGIRATPHQQTDRRDVEMMRIRLRQAFTFAEGPTLEALCDPGDGLWFAVFSLPAKAAYTRDELLALFRGACARIKKHLSDITVCVATPVGMEQAYLEIITLRQILFDNLTFRGSVFFAQDCKDRMKSRILPDHENVAALLRREDEAAIRKYVSQMIHDIQQNALSTAADRQTLLINWHQMIFFYLHTNQVDANQLFDHEEYHKAYQEAENSLSAYRDLLLFMAIRAMEYVRFSRDAASIVSRMKRFIADHLSEDLSRSRLAEVAYMNADYLAHLFKKETGVSIMKYTSSCRMKKAQELLLATEEPVYAVALKVGYPNSSYFAKQFKKELGMEPGEYRKKARRQ